MRDKIRNSYRGHIIFNGIVSGVITCLLEFIILINVMVIDRLAGTEKPIERVVREKSMGEMIFPILVYVMVGILIYTVCFYIMQKRYTRYVQEIAAAMQNISDGNLNVHVEVRGDDELADMALQLNSMVEEIKNLMAQEREAEKTKNDLITNVAHDLRTPLTSIIGYLELLSANQTLSDEKKQQYVEVALKKSQHLQKLIEDLFGFTKMSYGKVVVQMGELDIVKLMEQLLDEFYPVFSAQNLECKYHTNISSLKIRADGTLLARLFDNLINNAVKYGKDGKLIKVDLEGIDDGIIIKITNFGKIIPQAELGMIFDKFYRVEQSRSLDTGGAGLGLAIAKSITELHGGKIQAESSLKGTVFQVWLPISGENKEIYEIKSEK